MQRRWETFNDHNINCILIFSALNRICQINIMKMMMSLGGGNDGSAEEGTRDVIIVELLLTKCIFIVINNRDLRKRDVAIKHTTEACVIICEDHLTRSLSSRSASPYKILIFVPLFFFLLFDDLSLILWLAYSKKK